MPVLLGLKATVRRLLPTALVRRINSWRGIEDPNEMPYAPGGWPMEDPSEATWGSEVAAEHYEKHWESFLQGIKAPGPLGMANRRQLAHGGHVFANHLFLAYGYVLARMTHRRSEFSILDWGGSLGQYALLTERLIPDVQVSFYNKDLPGLRIAAEKFSPMVTYFDHDDQFADQTFDLVIASGALQYTRDWQGVLGRLTKAARQGLYLGRVPTSFAERAFVTLPQVAFYAQPKRIPMWIFSHDELIATIEKQGFKLEMEFITSEGLKVKNGPAQAEMRGYWFMRS